MNALENAVLERIRAYVADYFDPEKLPFQNRMTQSSSESMQSVTS